MPDAPEGGHSTHAGTLLDGVDVALAEDPPELPRDDEFDRAPVPPDGPLVIPLDPVRLAPLEPVPPLPLDPVPLIPPDVVPALPLTVGAVAVDELPAVDPLGVMPVVAPAVDCPGMAGFGDVTVALGAALPSETTPLLVMLPGVVTVCAKAGAAKPSEKNTA